MRLRTKPADVPVFHPRRSGTRRAADELGELLHHLFDMLVAMLRLFGKRLRQNGIKPRRDIRAERGQRLWALRRAGDFASQGKWEFAAREYEQLVARDPEDVSARYNLGVAQQRLGNLNDAETAYRRVLASQRNHVAARTNLALVLLNRGEPAAAIVELIRASEDGPGIGLVHFCLGNAYYQQRQWARAVRSFQRAVDLEPDNFEALGQLGASLSAIGDWSGACQAYQRATALKPMEWISNCNWALTLRLLGRLDEAERVFQKVLECVRALPADAVVRDTVCGTLATRLWDADWKREAIEVLELGLSYSPNDATLRHLLAAFTNQNVPVRAEDE